MRHHGWLVLGVFGLLSWAGAQTPDLAAPEVQQLRSEAEAQRVGLVQQRTEAVRTLIEGRLARARETLDKAKLSGNITARASATEALRIFTRMQESVEKNGSCPAPEKVRPDLERTVEELLQGVRAAEEKEAAELRKWNQEYARKLGAVLARQNIPVRDEAELLRLWQSLVPAAPAGGTAARTAAAAAAAAPVPAAVVQSRGDCSAWTPVMKLDATIHDAVEMISVPLKGVVQVREVSDQGGMGKGWKVQVVPIQEFAPGGIVPALRIVSVPPVLPMEVVEWPSENNGWTIELRARASRIPSRHVVVVETDAAAVKALAGGAPVPASAVGGGGGVASATGGGAPAPPPAAAHVPKVTVRFESRPEGAAVLLNNQELQERGAPLLTPFDYTLPATPVDLLFRKRGYLDGGLKQAMPVASKALKVTLTEAPNKADTTAKFSADAPADWTAMQVRIKKGNPVRITATGKWSCAPGGEMVDAGGYPNDDTFFKYYNDPVQYPRLNNRANYGQLLARVLPDGPIVALEAQGSFVAASDGELALAINEPAAARTDNRGTLKVRMLVGQ